MYVAHLLPPNGTGQLCNVLKGTPFQQQTLAFDRFIEELETDMQRARGTHAIGHDAESAMLVSASSRSRVEQEDRLVELAELASSAGVTVIDRMAQRTPDGHQRYLLGSGKLKDVLIQTLHKGADMVIFDQTLTPAQSRAISEMTDIKVIDRTQLILDIFARRAHSREGKVQVELAQLRYLLAKVVRKRHRAVAPGRRHRIQRPRRNQSWKRIGAGFEIVSPIWSVNSSTSRATRTSAVPVGLGTGCPSFLWSATPMPGNRPCSTS